MPIPFRIMFGLSFPRPFARLPVLSGICKCVLFGGCTAPMRMGTLHVIPCYVVPELNSGLVLIPHISACIPVSFIRRIRTAGCEIVRLRALGFRLWQDNLILTASGYDLGHFN